MVAEVVPTTNGRQPDLLTKDQILAADDLEREVVNVPEWGGDVMVQSLTGSARDRLEARFSDARGRMDPARAGDFRAAYVAEAIIDADGRLVFGLADIQALGKKSSRALQRVFDVAARLSAARVEDLDGMAEDLKSVPNGDSGSD